MTDFTIKNGRLTATAAELRKEDFFAIAAQMGVTPGYAKKAAGKAVSVMQIVDVATPVKTINTKDGSVQAEKVAQPGDAIMTRLDKDGSVTIGVTDQPDQWAVDGDKLEILFEKTGESNEYGDLVCGKNEGYFIELPNGGEIVPSWGGTQTTSDGIVFYSETTGTVYLNEADSFAGTFVIEKEQAAV